MLFRSNTKLKKVNLSFKHTAVSVRKEVLVIPKKAKEKRLPVGKDTSVTYIVVA